MMIMQNDNFVFVLDHPSGGTVIINNEHHKVVVVKTLLHGLLWTVSALFPDVKLKMAGPTRSKLVGKKRGKSPEAHSTPANKKPRGRPKRTVNVDKQLTSVETQFNARQNDLQHEGLCINIYTLCVYCMLNKTKNTIHFGKIPVSDRNRENQSSQNAQMHQHCDSPDPDNNLDFELSTSVHLQLKNTTNEHGDDISLILLDEENPPNANQSVNSSHGTDVDGTKAKQAKKNPTKTRARNLRPEEKRTLQILAEKFRTDQTGATCQVDGCSSNLKVARASHLKVHPQLYQNMFPGEFNREKQIELEIYNMMQDAIELVTVNGYPFSMLNASGMRGFVQARKKQLEGYSLPINRLDIVKSISETSDEIKRQIKSELHGRMISLMFDM